MTRGNPFKINACVKFCLQFQTTIPYCCIAWYRQGDNTTSDFKHKLLFLLAFYIPAVTTQGVEIIMSLAYFHPQLLVLGGQTGIARKRMSCLLASYPWRKDGIPNIKCLYWIVLSCSFLAKFRSLYRAPIDVPSM